MSEDLSTKYRPRTLEEVIGQDEVVKSIKGVLKRQSSRSMIFTGPAGTGKTTLARIVASLVGVDAGNVIEVDAATNTGVEAMREVLSSTQYRGLLGSNRIYIIDEVHRLSGSAFDSMLKKVEEPPPGVYWALCTTEPSKVPETIQSRCTRFQLKPVAPAKIFELLKMVATNEGYKTSEDVLYFISEKCNGSPRRALTSLAMCPRTQERKEAASILSSSTEDGEAYQLAQMLSKGTPDWSRLMNLLKQLKDTNGEGIRLTVVGYFTKALLDATDDESVQRGLAVLDAFSRPYPQGATIYPVMLSLGEIIFAR